MICTFVHRDHRHAGGIVFCGVCGTRVGRECPTCAGKNAVAFVQPGKAEHGFLACAGCGGWGWIKT